MSSAPPSLSLERERRFHLQRVTQCVNVAELETSQAAFKRALTRGTNGSFVFVGIFFLSFLRFPVESQRVEI